FYFLKKCSPIDAFHFDSQELNRRPYQVLSTLYHLSRFLLQNAEFDKFDPQKHTVEQADKKKQLKPADRWLLSKLQKAIEEYTAKLDSCEFNFALGVLEDFVIETLSRLYVPMVRKELWTDDPQTLERRLAVYATLWHTLKEVTLLFNPVTPFLSEALYQKVFKKLDSAAEESVNFEKWPKPDAKMRNKTLEEEFETVLKCVSLVYAARQSAKLKRRWPLSKTVVVASENVEKALKTAEDVFLEMTNVKNVEYCRKIPEEVSSEEWVQASEEGLQVFLLAKRDDKLLGEGLMRDVARRVQALRKELGYMPTDILKAVLVTEVEKQDVELLQPYMKEMGELVRARKVCICKSRKEAEAEWHEFQVDDKKIYIAILEH
ncbi:class I tRNA ligase family protein, partial [Candidatus Bathyarchaeota archaeon]|nr:class I tRNA ligase family protein [Candidatus Bathyarchaeota archaeon]